MSLVLRIALAISQINPSLPKATVSDYATEVVEQASAQALDPWLIVELVHRETHWIHTLIRHEADGTCSVGLGQINGLCRKKTIRLLLEPHANLHRVAVVLRGLQRSCKVGCRQLGWVRGYNPGSDTYLTSILHAVRARHAGRRRGRL